MATNVDILKAGQLSSLSIGAKLSFPPTDIVLPSELGGLQAYSIGENYFCNKSPADLWDTTSITNQLYVDSSRVDDTGNGLSWATAFKAIQTAITAANASGQATRIIVRAGTYTRNISFSTGGVANTMAVPVVIQATYGRVVTGPFDNLTYTKTSGRTNIYQVNRSQVSGASNPSIKGQYGNLIYSAVTTLDLCDATPGSFFTDGTVFYVHTHDSSPATNRNVRAYLSARGCEFSGNSNILMQGIDFEGGLNGALVVRDGSTNTVIAVDCSFKYATSGQAPSSIAARDGVQLQGCKLFAAFNCDASLNTKDGFNAKIQSSVKPFTFLVNCSGYENGTLSTSQSNNGFTVHDGLFGISINSRWLGSIGTNCGHINAGTVVWQFGDVAGMSDGDTLNGGAINYGAFGAWDGTSKLYLENCTDISSSIGVYSASGGKVFIRNHKGSGRKVGDISQF